ncbi:MAG: sulfite exporter TauE/SafE family protein, partial [Rhizobiales bacterium]|nr:sulfite exporter TauE/SafE family protein [Hyphomicrobiales bacterium]
MLAWPTLGLLAVSVLGTSFISGIFGMAGGMVLVGVLLALFDVAPAMLLFGVTQTAANGWRCLLWRKHVRWS